MDKYLTAYENGIVIEVVVGIMCRICLFDFREFTSKMKKPQEQIFDTRKNFRSRKIVHDL